MAFSPDWIRTPELLVALVTSFVGLLVLRGNRRSPANQFFAFYLFLVAGNFASYFIAAGYAPDVRNNALWIHIATLFLIWDPAVLAYFASLFPRRILFATSRPAFVLLAAIPLTLTLVFLSNPAAFDPARSPQRLTLLLYLTLAYAYCLAVLVFGPTPEGLARKKQTEFLLLGFGVALIPRFGLLIDDLGLFGFASSPGRVWARILVTWSVLLALWVGSHVRSRPTRRGAEPLHLRWVLGTTALFLAILTLFWLGGLALAEELPEFYDFGLPLYFSFRWILFALIVGYAIARYQVFDIDVRVKRFLERVVVLGGPLVLFIIGYLLLNRLLLPNLLSDPQLLSAILAAGIAIPLALLLHRASPRLKEIVLPRVTADASYLRARKLEVYGAHLEAAAADGRLGPKPDAPLEAIRQELEISIEEHRALERLLRRGTSVAPRLEDRIASGDPLFGRYRILRRLDAGGFADVFLSHDREQHRNVVIKRLHPRFSQDERVLRAFLREAEVAGRIRHANVLPVHEVLREAGDAYLVMDYVEGGNLEDVRRKGSPRPVAESAGIARDILSGLQATHDVGVYHRDLKPSNILLTREGRAVITDFGVAHVPNLDKTLTGLSHGGNQPGTVSYMAPEQAVGGLVDGRADIYAVGVILWELLTGEQLFPAEGKSEFEIRKRIAQGVSRAQIGRAPAPLRPVLAKALARIPERRYQAPREFLAALLAHAPSPTTQRGVD